MQREMASRAGRQLPEKMPEDCRTAMQWLHMPMLMRVAVKYLAAVPVLAKAAEEEEWFYNVDYYISDYLFSLENLVKKIYVPDEYL